MKPAKVIFFLIFISSVCFSQLLPLPRNFQKSYDRGIRSLNGSPGKNYWQNTADYQLNVSFDPVNRLISGTVDIVYTNNSPDTLKQILFKLYPNLYKKGSPRTTKIAPADLSDGMSIDSIWMNEKMLDRTRWNIDGTNMLLGRQLLVHGQIARIRISYHYTLNKGSHNRTGEVEPNAAFIAYFFPRVAVYDDIDGWNRNPYLGPRNSIMTSARSMPALRFL